MYNLTTDSISRGAGRARHFHTFHTMGKDIITEQRDRFLGFAFASADLMLELDEAGCILFSHGAATGMTGRDEKALAGKLWTEIFAKSESFVLRDMFQSAIPGKRAGPLLVALRTPSGVATKNVLLTLIKMPERHSIYVTLAYPNNLTSRLGEEKRQSAQEVLGDKEDFGQAAQSALKTAKEMGQAVDLTLFDMSGLENLKPRVSGEEWSLMSDMMSSLLKSRSLDGQTATKISENQFGLLHDRNITAQNIQSQLSALLKEFDPQGEGEVIEPRSLDADMEALSEREAAKALMYTLTEFERLGTDLTVENLDQGFKGFLTANAQKIQKFKTMIANLDFQLYFQPIVSLSDLKVSHYEILTRFRDGSSTYDWVVFGEDVGLAADFDLAVCERIIRYIMQEPKTVKTRFAVNISGQSIQDEKFFAALHDRLKANKELAERMMFEITESANIKELDRVNDFIKILQAEGFHVCLDDFGAGSASFQYLHKLHVDYVKLDGAYTQNILSSKRDETMVKNLAQLCQDLGVSIVAERVETQEEAQRLRQMGIEHGQGYWFAKPLVKPDYKVSPTQLKQIQT